REQYSDHGGAGHREGLSFLDGRGQPSYRFLSPPMWNDELLVLTHAPGLVLAVGLGALWGSFANVCIYRWPPSDEFPKGRSVVAPGSHCFACKAPVRWYDNVPLVSWLWLRGRCRACNAPYSARYLIVEA